MNFKNIIHAFDGHIEYSIEETVLTALYKIEENEVDCRLSSLDLSNPYYFQDNLSKD